MSICRLGASSSAPFFFLILFCAGALPSTAQADTDACTVLTPAQVGTAVGVPVAEGKHVTPTFVKTCTWNASGSSNVKSVTLFLQTAAAYDGGKQMASQFKVAVYATLPVDMKEAMEMTLAKEALAKL